MVQVVALAYLLLVGFGGHNQSNGYGRRHRQQGCFCCHKQDTGHAAGVWMASVNQVVGMWP